MATQPLSNLAQQSVKQLSVVVKNLSGEMVSGIEKACISSLGSKVINSVIHV